MWMHTSCCDLSFPPDGGKVGPMKTITIHELHEKTEEWVRMAAHDGGIKVADQGKTIARIVPEAAPSTPPEESEVPYFARRQMSPEFEKYLNSGKLCGGPDITQYISEDRDRDVL